MRLVRIIPGCLLVALLATQVSAAPARILKVLPQFLDLEGRHAPSPSLYDRDAYQAELRAHPEKVSGMRFAVQWNTKEKTAFRLRIELRGIRHGETTRAVVEESVRHRGLFSSWANPALTGDAYKKFGMLTAWRATLWNGENLVVGQNSFLW
jgi:hypothetical protein